MTLLITRFFFDDNSRVGPTFVGYTTDGPTGILLIEQGVAIEYIPPAADPLRVPERVFAVPTNMKAAKEIQNANKQSQSRSGTGKTKPDGGTASCTT